MSDATGSAKEQTLSAAEIRRAKIKAKLLAREQQLDKGEHFVEKKKEEAPQQEESEADKNKRLAEKKKAEEEFAAKALKDK